MPKVGQDDAKPRRAPRRRPRQERSQSLVKAILDATAELLVAGGPERTTTNKIAERAGVSIGSVYQYFPNKHALYEALAQRYVGQLREALDAVWPEVVASPIEQLLPTLLTAILRVSERDPTLSGMLHLTAIPAGSFAVVMEFERDLETRGGALLAAQAGRFVNPLVDPALSARLLVRALGGIVGRTLAAEPESITSPRFVVELMRLLMGYLGPVRET
ncbi:MAG: TetR/AcrR family transcriptional regulator [Myxococcota bacterium]